MHPIVIFIGICITTAATPQETDPTIRAVFHQDTASGILETIFQGRGEQPAAFQGLDVPVSGDPVPEGRALADQARDDPARADQEAAVPAAEAVPVAADKVTAQEAAAYAAASSYLLYRQRIDGGYQRLTERENSVRVIPVCFLNAEEK